jgi:hypothetical protein
MVAAWHLLANARPGWDLRLFWPALTILGVFALGILIIVWVNRWRKRMSQESAGDQMVSFRELYERGELSPEEYDRIRSRLARRLRQELDVPAPAPPAPPEGPARPPRPPDAAPPVP